MDERNASGTRVIQQTVPGTLRAGVARSDITNRSRGVRIHDPLYAKALVLDDGDTRLAIVAMDAVAIGGICDVRDDFLPRLRRRIQSELGIPGHNVLVNASHNHQPGRMLCDDRAQLERTFSAVRRAAQNMEEVRVGWGSGREDRFIMNRTLLLKDGKAWTIRHANPCPPDEEVAGIGPVDPEIGVLRVDRKDGTPLAVVFNFACHPLFGDSRGSLTANFPGSACKVIEENLGGEAMALFLQGAGGDVIDVFFKDFTRVRDTEPLGTMLGLSTLKAWRKIRTHDVKLKVLNETIRLPRRTDIPRRMKELKKEQAELLQSLQNTSLNFKAFLPLYLAHKLDPAHPADYSYRYMQEARIGSDDMAAMDAHNRRCIEKYLRNIRAMERLARIQDELMTLRFHKALNDRSGERTIAAEVQGIRIGDCVLITSPAEMLAQVGLNVKKASPFRHTFMAAFSNGYMHYGAPAESYAKCGYEVTECLLAPGWQRIYEKKAAQIIRKLR